MKASIPGFMFVLLGVLFASLALAAPGPERGGPPNGIEGLWTGKDTNGFPPDAALSVKLNTNGEGAVMVVGLVGIPGAFTYSLSKDQIICFTNGTPPLTGTLRYDALADMLVYQQKPTVASALRQHHGPVLLLRDTNEVRNAVLGCILGATNHAEVMSRMGAVLDTLTNRFGVTLTRPEVTAEKRA